MLNLGKEIIRINTAKNNIEVSKNNGASWIARCTETSTMGTLQDLADGGKEILLTTSKGLYRSQNNGALWTKKG